MPRKMLSFDVVESKPESHFIRLPEGATYKGVGVSPSDQTHFRVWFEGDSTYQKNQMQLFILGDDKMIPDGADHLGSFIHTDETSRHVFMAPYRPVCKCECATDGECNHEWNGFDMTTCSTCGMPLVSHNFPPRIRTSPYPRLRNKSSWQKDDCLMCENPSTKEVVFKQAFIRCCGDPKCIDEALEIAKRSGSAYHER